MALLGRRESFLAHPDWTTTPWEQHPKAPLDRLFDIMLSLTPILDESDRVVPLQATMARRAKVQGLLRSCLILEAQFHDWFAGVVVASGDAPWWPDELGGPGGDIPFSSPYAFRDAPTAMAMLYYWASQVPFHRCVETLHAAIFQPVIDAYPDMWPPNLPLELQIDPAQYQDGRGLAANICRGLDAALDGTTQPDMLLAPMTVAADFYRDINAASQEGLLEMLWLESFKKRLAAKGQHVATVLQAQRWVELANFGAVSS